MSAAKHSPNFPPFFGGKGAPQTRQHFGNLLQRGQLAMFPTDTIPGIHGRADQPAVVERAIAAKQRPPEKPFVLLASSAAAANEWTEVSPRARQLWAEEMPTTLLLPRRSGGLLADYFPTFLELAIRVPRLPALRQFLRQVGAPIFSTSVNQSGQAHLVSAADIAHQFPHFPVAHCGPARAPSRIIRLLKNGQQQTLR